MKQDPFPASAIPVAVPELGAEDAPIQFVTWLVPRRANLIVGERIAELLTAGAVFQLESPAEGRLIRQSAEPGQTVAPGEVLGAIRPPRSAEPDA